MKTLIKFLLKAFLIKTLITLILAPLFSSSLAFGAESSDDDDTKSTKAAPEHIVDVKPLIDFDALGENVPGGIGLGVGAEKRLGEKWYLTTEAVAWTLDRSTDNVKDLEGDQDDDDDDLIAKRQRSGALLVGARYYGRPAGRSWYAGGKTGLMTSNSTYVVNDSEIQDKATGVPFLFEGGYRFMWDNGMILRFGGRGGKTLLFARDVETKKGEESERSEKKVKAADPEFSPSFEVAVGYAF